MPLTLPESIPRNRKTALVIVVIVEALLILALLSLAVSPSPPRKAGGDLSTFDIAAEKAAPEKARKSTTTQKATITPPVETPPITLPTPPIPTPNMVVVSKDDFAAADISKLGKSGSGSSKGVYGPGEGPGGKTLYPAEWYVEPPDSALRPYLPDGAPPGSWAMIACQTIARYHVENCYTLGQSHAGLSSALRQAAWQFLVRPPRVDGKVLVGAWVRIRFDFTRKPKSDDTPTPDSSGE